MEALKKAKLALDSNNFSLAQDLLLKHAFAPGQTAEDYYAWGEIARTLSLLPEAKRLYQNALREKSSFVPALKGLFSVYYEEKDYYQSFKILKKLLPLDPHSPYQEIFLHLAEKLGYYGILKYYKSTPSPIPFSFLENLLEKDISQIHEKFSFFFKDASCFAELSVDAYGKVNLNEPFFKLSSTKLKDHFLGLTHLVFFPVKEDMQFSSFFLGLKLSEKLVKKALNLESFFVNKTHECATEALRVFHYFIDLGLNPALEKLHNFYYRIWFLLTKPLSLGHIRSFLENALQKIGNLSGGLVPIEGIPQVSLLQKYNLQYVSLPLGINPLTLERSQFLDEDGKPYSDQIEFVKKLTPISTEFLKDVSRKLSSSPFFSFSFPEDPFKSLSQLRKCCHLLDYVISKAEAGKLLSREEKLAIVLTVGFLKNGDEMVHQILSQTPDYSYGKVKNLLKNLPPHPVSCLKLELWLKEISISEPCRCVFEEKLKNRYPSPLLHIDVSLVPTYTEVTYKLRSPEDLVRTYLRQKEKLIYFETLLKNYLYSHKFSTLKVGSFIVNLKEDKLEVKKI
jgi:tetratricopeptide (TPR) repeat protein